MPLRITRRSPAEIDADAVVRCATGLPQNRATVTAENGRTVICVPDCGNFPAARYTATLELAVEKGCNSIALPLFGAPSSERVLSTALKKITEFLTEHELTVYLCVPQNRAYAFNKQRVDDIKSFIDSAEDGEHEEICALPSMPLFVCSMAASATKSKSDSLRDFVADTDKGFRERLFDLIDKSGLTDAECYKRACVDKRTFSKIKSNKNYRPSKPTAIAFAIALELDMEDTQALLATAGFTLSKSSVFDNVIRYFIIHGNYDIFEINEALFEFDQPLLGNI